jgi:hypothetical protein
MFCNLTVRATKLIHTHGMNRWALVLCVDFGLQLFDMDQCSDKNCDFVIAAEIRLRAAPVRGT